MKHFFTHFVLSAVLVMGTLTMFAQQLPDPGFENWTGTKFDGEVQLKDWHASNVEQVGLKFNFEHRETGRNGGYCVMVKDQEVGAMGITEASPGYVSLGQPWQYLPSITQVSQATAGDYGGINFTYRPDSMVIWVKRTGSDWSREDFHMLFYSWKGTAKGSKYKNKNNGCTSYSTTDEESDVRQALDGNECGTDTKATQVAEGWLRDRKEYTNWTRLCVPIYYLNDEVPQKCNVIISASNYPNFRANSGLYPGNSLYADDVQLIYSSKIQQLYIGGKVWNGFDPNSSAEQVYSVGRTTVMPEVYAVRGVGSLTNTKGTTVNFPGRRLSGSEINIQYGTVDGNPTIITVNAADGSSTMTYRIKMVQAPSDNAKLSNIMVNGEPLSGFNPMVSAYNVALPYGTTTAPVVTYTPAEDGQVVTVTQATSTTGTATIRVTAPDNTTKMTYTLNFSVAQLSDNTLQGIKVNGELIPDFVPTLTTYKIELPLGTATMPTVQAISAYPAGAQTIVYTAPSQIDGGQYKVSVTTPGNQVAKVYKLNFKITASSNSKLRDLQMGGYITNFNPNSTTYYVSLPMGTTSLPQITYTKGDNYQTVTIEEGGVEGTTRVIVTAANGDQTIYKIICSKQKSEISYLNNIYLDGVALTGFNSNTYRYTVNLPIGTTTLPVITYDQGDPYQTVQVNMGGLNATTRIFVTADDGSTSLYEIVFTVELADVSTLNMITIGGTPLQGFDPEVTEYSVALPQGTTALPEITFTKHDEWQNVSVRTAGVNGDTKITVRSQAGTQTVYVLHFSVTTSANTTLAAVYFNGVRFADFDASVREYDIQLGEGVSQVPAVSFDKGESSQKVVATLEGTIYTIRVVSESGVQGVYTFRFTIQKSENAYLNGIYLNGTPLTGFHRETLVYQVELTTATCPVITVDKDPSQHVTITTPVALGEARIIVSPESGASNTYIINFVSSVQPNLSMIFADGVQVPSFSPTTYEYDIPYSGALPVITYTKMNESQTVTMVTDDSHARLYVSVGGDEQVYELTFIPNYSADATLRSIAANGTVLAGFAADKFNYSMPLPMDGVMPLITYERQSDNQHVVAGQSAQYTYSLVVTAESGVTQTYKINFITGASDTTSLLSAALDGTPITFDDNYTSTQTIEQGRDLPEFTYEKRDGQTTVYAETTESQQLIVVAENGNNQTYTVNYNRTETTNALLKGINILRDGEWQPLTGFAENTFAYNVTLPLGTLAAPCVWPLAGKPGQTITVTYGPADGNTTIHVLSSDDQTQDYVITFAVTKSTNTKLGSLSIDGASYSVDETDITIPMDFGATEPYEVEFTKAEDSQLIEFISAPINGVTKIIVTAENGDKRTYSIRYNVAVPEGENRILSVNYIYVDANGDSHTGSIEPVKGQVNEIKLPFGSTSFDVTGYTKSYPEQAVLFYNGGIRRGATIVATANREGVEDAVYTIKPVMPDFDEAGKLEELKFKGATIPNFVPYVYNYMINVTAQPTAADFTYTAYNGATVTPSAINDTKKQITFSVEGGETYSVCWFYEHDGMYQENGKWYSYLDFSADRWKPATYNGYKPYNWKVPGDCADSKDYSILVTTFLYTTGKEVMMGGENGAMLSTMRGSSLNGSVPGMMCLNANMSVSLQTSGNSTFRMQGSASTGVSFRNTPEQFALDYNPLQVSGEITKWTWQLLMSNGSSTASTDYEGNFSTLNTLKTAVKNINYGTIGKVSKYTLLIKAADKPTPASSAAKCYGGGTISESSLIVQNLRFIYNSELTAATVNGKATVKSGNTFTYTLAEGEDIVGMPALKFTGAVHDQMQTIEWLNNGEWDNGELKAKVINYGENSQDTTEYYVILERPAVTSLNYVPNFGGYPTTVSNDTTYVNMPYGTKALPDFSVTPESIHQLFTISKSGNVVNVTVKAESGEPRTDIYVFREVKTADARLANIVAAGLTPAFSADVTDYTITAEKMPNVTFAKKRTTADNDLGQTVDLSYTATGATLLVTSADGTAQQTYTIAFTATQPATDGKLLSISRQNAIISGFNEDTYSYNARKVDNVGFERKEGQESVAVVETLTDDYLSIAVTGTTASHNYTITYPTEASTNADLGGIFIDGNPYAEFMPQQLDYTYESDDPVDVVFVLSEPGQTMHITVTNLSNAPSRKIATRSVITVFNVTITAESGESKTYVFTLRPESSDVNTLAGISIAGTPLEGFYPERTDYTYEIQSATPKLSEPAMPEISYTLGQESQTVVVEPAATLGAATIITVTPENGNANEAREYRITMTATPSRNADLTNILINGEPVSGFKSSRTNYSMQVYGDQVTVDYATGDPFQTVQVTKTDDDVQLTVTAQDGQTQRVYEVEIWRAAMSNNANLANILLDRMTMAEYAAAHYIEDLYFDEKTYRYTIPLTLMDVMPDIAASVQEDAQTVEILTAETSRGTEKTIRVTAEDGETVNEYKLLFEVEKSANTRLAMIYLNGDSLPGFDENRLAYTIALPVGVKTLPEVDPAKSEMLQSITKQLSEDNMRTDITVTAENGQQAIYSVTFLFTLSEADTLKGIFADGQLIEGFEPTAFYYSYALPMGVRTLPALDYEQADQWQNVTMDTITAGKRTTYNYTVISESGSKNIYTVIYEVQNSNVDTLQMISLDGKPMIMFEPQRNDYTVTLPQGSTVMPQVSWLQGDEWQTVDTVYNTGYVQVIVSAEDNHQRVYTIHFDIAKSSNVSLAGITIGGKPLEGYDDEKLTYTVKLPYGATTLPAITYAKAEPGQNVTISIEAATVSIVVIAEDGIATQTYTLNFVPSLSPEAHLAAIYVDDISIATFVPDLFEYAVSLPYGTTEMPAITAVPVDTTATIAYEQEQNIVTISVTSADGENMYDYVVIFTVELCNINSLTDLRINGETIEGFHQDTLVYTISYPMGTDSTAFIRPEQISYTLADSSATVAVSEIDGTILVQVTAENGTDVRVYVISQRIAKSSNSLLSDLTVGGTTIAGFDDSTFVYTYILLEGETVPEIIGIPQDELSEVSVTYGAPGEQTFIYCTAQDGSETVYSIWFVISTTNTAKAPTKQDVLFKQTGPDQFTAYTIRNNTWFALYDHEGRMFLNTLMPVCNPNQVSVAYDPQDNEILTDATGEGVTFTVPNHGEVFFYLFYSDNQRIQSGKFIMP